MLIVYSGPIVGLGPYCRRAAGVVLKNEECSLTVKE
jgi:hypothetical protein